METGRVDAGSGSGHGQAWVELDRSYSWDDLVVPRRERESLRKIAAHLRQRDQVVRWGGVAQGLTLLFVGEPGTGKVMAARILGADLDRPVLKVDLRDPRLHDRVDAAALIDGVYTVADRDHAIIVFVGLGASDGTAAAKGSTSAIDRSSLLRRGDRRTAVVVLAWSTMPGGEGTISEAADYRVAFPFPGAPARGEIWRRELPSDVRPREADIRHLARSFEISGGAIRRCCLAARADAQNEGVPVGMPHVLRALERSDRLSAVDDHAQPAPPRLGDAPRRTKRARRRQLSVRRSGFALAACLAIGALGYGVERATSGRSPAAATGNQASSGLLRISYPVTWRLQRSPAIAINGLADALAVAPAAPSQGALVIGMAQTQDPTLLPRSLLTTLPKVPVAQVVTLGGVRFYRYSNLSPRGVTSPESVYAVPTTAGTIIGVCADRAATPGFAANCESILATLKLTSASPLVPGPSPTYASALDQVVTTLSTARSTAGAKLRAANSPTALAAAANQLATAHTRAASELLGLKAGQAAAANSALARAFQGTASAYTALARAASRKDQRAYRAAGSELTSAGAAVSSALSQLGKLGYAETGVRSP